MMMMMMMNRRRAIDRSSAVRSERFFLSLIKELQIFDECVEQLWVRYKSICRPDYE